MPAVVLLRPDFDATKLREVAKRCPDSRQTRRLLALAAVYDGMLSSSVKCNTTARYRARYDLLRLMFNMTTWFCDAYASWQKGGIEDANSRLRRWLPRNLDIDALDEQELQDVVFTANLTPRK